MLAALQLAVLSVQRLVVVGVVVSWKTKTEVAHLQNHSLLLTIPPLLLLLLLPLSPSLLLLLLLHLCLLVLVLHRRQVVGE